MNLSTAVLALTTTLPTASAAEELRCQELWNDTAAQIACYKENYPRKVSAVKAVCGPLPKGANKRACRKREYQNQGLPLGVRPVAASDGSSPPSRPPVLPGAAATGQRPAAAGSGPRPGQQAGPTYLSVRIIGATVAPSKSSGQDWDGARVTPELAEAVAALATGGSTAALQGQAGDAGAALFNNAAQGTSAPDVMGYVTIVGRTHPSVADVASVPLALGTPDNKVQDSYTPSFTYSAEYRDWPFSSAARMEVRLWDADLANHDPIGVAQISLNDLLEARDSGGIYQIPLANQTSGQLVSLTVSVMDGTRRGPQITGTRW